MASTRFAKARSFLLAVAAACVALLVGASWVAASNVPFAYPVGPVVDAGAITGNYGTGLGVNLASSAVAGPLSVSKLAGGADGGVLESVGGVATWATQLPLGAIPPGPAGTVLSSDGGVAAWTSPSIPIPVPIADLAAGPDGSFLETISGAASWTTQIPPSAIGSGPDGGFLTTSGGVTTWTSSVPLASLPTGAANTVLYSDGGAASWQLPPPSPPANGSWSATAIYVDVTGGSDTNTCLSSGSPCKTLLHVAQLFGTWSPRPAVAMIVHVVGAQTDNSDPLAFVPQCTNGGSMTVLGTPTTLATGTISGLTAKTRGAPGSLLSLTLPGSPAKGLLVTNTTRGSSALIQNVTGSVATMATPITTGLSEDDTWANGDSVIVQSMPSIVPLVAGGTGQASNCLTVSQFNFISPDGVGVNDTQWQAGATLEHVYSSRTLIVQPAGTFQVGAYDVGVEGNVLGGGFGEANSGYSTYFVGGFLDSSYLTSGVLFAGDVQLGTGAAFGTVGDAVFENAYVRTIVVVNSGSSEILHGTVLWGPGALSVRSGATLNWGNQSTDTAVSHIMVAGGIDLDQSASSAFDFTVVPPQRSGLRSITPAKLDATVASGGYGGCAIGSSGSHLCLFQPLGPSATPYVAPQANGGTGLTSCAADQLLAENHAGSALACVTPSGDWTLVNGVATLATVDSTPGSYGGAASIPVVTVNGKGLVTSSSSVASNPTQVDGIAYPAGPLTVGTVPIASSSSAVTYGPLNLALPASITGVLPVANGGTGDSTLLSHGVLVGAGTAAVSSVSVGGAGIPLLGNAGANPSFQALNLAGGSGVVTGALPDANQGCQTLSGGDVVGTTCDPDITGMTGDGLGNVTMANDVNLVCTSGDPASINLRTSTTGLIESGPSGFVGPSLDNPGGNEHVCTTATNCVIGGSANTTTFPSLAGHGITYVESTNAGQLQNLAIPTWHTTVFTSNTTTTVPATDIEFDGWGGAGGGGGSVAGIVSSGPGDPGSGSGNGSLPFHCVARGLTVGDGLHVVIGTGGAGGAAGFGGVQGGPSIVTDTTTSTVLCTLPGASGGAAPPAATPGASAGGGFATTIGNGGVIYPIGLGYMIWTPGTGGSSVASSASGIAGADSLNFPGGAGGANGICGAGCPPFGGYGGGGGGGGPGGPGGAGGAGGNGTTGIAGQGSAGSSAAPNSGAGGGGAGAGGNCTGASCVPGNGNVGGDGGSGQVTMRAYYRRAPDNGSRAQRELAFASNF